MMVIAVGLLGLMAVQVRSLTTVALAGQRQAGAQLANRAMEQLRALPYGTVAGGMVCSDLTADPNVVLASASGTCTARFKPAYDASIDETVVTQTGTQVEPLYPHQQVATKTVVGSTQYVVRAYVTRVDPDPTVVAGYWLTAVSTWSSPATRGVTKSIATRSQLYSPTGCLALTTHPFSGPCQAFFYSDAGVSGGGVTVASTRAGLGIVDGVDVISASATLLDLSARTQTEQVVSAQSQMVTSAGALTRASTVIDRSGGAAATSSADTDPSSGTSTSPASASTVTASGVSSLTSNGGGSQFALQPDSSASGSTLSTMVSAASPACADEQGVAVANGQACTTGTSTPGGLTNSTLKLSALGARTMALADIEAAATPSRAWGARFLTGTSTHCTSATGVGCVGASVQRSLGSARAGGLAPLTSGDKILNSTGADVSGSFGSASSPTSLVTVSGYTDRARAESGLGAGATATPTRAGTLKYWNGSAFATVDLSTAGAQVYTVPVTTGAYGSTLVAVNGTVTLTAPAAVATGASPCLVAACALKASAGSVVANLTYAVSTGSTVVGAFSVTLDLGTALAATTYKAAPSA